jgi:dihydrofolate reductase
MLRLIAALDSERGIADDSGIPWDLPTDKAFYRKQLETGLILMGAGTYREHKSPSAGRTNYVVTHSTEPLKEGFVAVHDVEEFLRSHADEVIQDIGGAGLYEQTLQYADELVLTQLEGNFDCTKFFPEYHDTFELITESEPTTENGITFRFQTWKRRA